MATTFETCGKSDKAFWETGTCNMTEKPVSFGADFLKHVWGELSSYISSFEPSVRAFGEATVSFITENPEVACGAAGVTGVAAIAKGVFSLKNGHKVQSAVEMGLGLTTVAAAGIGYYNLKA